MWTLIKRELKDNCKGMLGWVYALVIADVVFSISYLKRYQIDVENILGFMKDYEGFFNICILSLALFAVGLGIYQIYSDQMKKISAFLVMQAMTRERVFFAKMITGIVLVFIGTIIPSVSVIVILKIHPPLLPIDYSALFIKWMLALVFCLTSYLSGLAFGLSKSQWMLIFSPMILLVLVLAMMFIEFSPTSKFIVLILMGLAFLLYARQQFLRASL
jgi:hypothetical protein